MSAKYWVCQYVADLFRNEPKNVGVLVERGESRAARFYAETSAQQIDGRKIATWSHRDVYRQWVEYWRRALEAEGIEALLKTSGAHYRVMPGGDVTDIGSDSAEDVTNYLYALLISEGGFAEAIASEDQPIEPKVLSLKDDIGEALSALELVAPEGEYPVRHPIRKGATVRGASVSEHRPDFSQENGELYVMEVVDFTKPQKKYAANHAGRTAYMFKDIIAERPDSVPIAIVRLRSDDLKSQDVMDGMCYLNAEARQVINWLEKDGRDKFLHERMQVANSV